MDEEIRAEGRAVLHIYQPKSRQLSFLLTLMTISTRLESISDYSVYISHRSMLLNSVSEIRETRFIEPVFQMLLHHANKLRKACEDRHIETIRKLWRFNGTQEERIKTLTAKLGKVSEGNNTAIPCLAEVIFITRALQQIWQIFGRIEEDILAFADNL